MLDQDPHEYGRPAGSLLRYLAFALAVLMLVQISLPPHQVRSFLYGPFVCAGFFFIGRGHSFPNTWWFWLASGVLFFDICGFQLPIPNNQLPQQVALRISMIAGCGSALVATIIGVAKFFSMFVRDIRERRPVKWDD